MIKTLRLIFISFHIRFVIMANRIINFLRFIPDITGKAHSQYALKAVFSVLGVLFVMNTKILLHVAYIAFLVLVGVVLHQSIIHGGFVAFLHTDGTALYGISAYGVVSYALTAWFFLSFVAGITGIGSITINGLNHQNDKVMLNLLRTNPTAYAKSRMLVDSAAVILLYIPTLLIAFPIVNIPLWGIIPAVTALLSFRLMGEAVNLLMFRNLRVHFGHRIIMYPGLLIYLPAFIVPYFAGVPNWEAVLASPLILLTLLPGIFAFVYMRKYPLFGEILRDKLHRNDKLYAKAETMEASELHGVEKWDKHIKTDNLQNDKHYSKSGFDYLNAIFFDRHKKFFANKIFVRCAILLALFVGSSIFFGILGDEPTAFFAFAPMLLFIFSMASMGRVVTSSVFSNCDIQMLNYPYYRTQQTILASFKSRFGAILRHNFVITVFIIIAALGALFAVFRELNFLYAGAFIILMICTSVFFAFSDLFLYYVIQPFDSAGKSKSAVYSIVNFVIGVLVWVQINLQVNFFTYVTIVAAVTALYIGVGMFLLPRFAPKNFKLR